MRQEQEQFRSVDRGVATNPPRGWNRIDTSVGGHLGEAIRQERIRQIRFNINQEDNKEEKEEEVRRKAYDRKPDGLEPFVDPQDPLRTPQEEGVLFVNKYNGNFAQKMELNRKGVERALKIAHLDGQVFLTNLAQSRSRSAEAQGEELAAKRFLFFGERRKKLKKKIHIKE